MATLKKYDLSGAVLGEVEIEDSLLPEEVCSQMIKDYLVAIRANARQWSANTKTRPEVSHSGQKPHPQKGTGRARQGYLGAPQYKGGGRVFGPRPKSDQHIRINKKERRTAIQFLLSEKIRAGRLHLLHPGAGLLVPKTKMIACFLQRVLLKGSRVLFLSRSAGVGELRESFAAEREAINKSVRNIPKTAFRLLRNISGYDVTLAKHVVVMDGATDELMEMLRGEVYNVQA